MRRQHPLILDTDSTPRAIADSLTNAINSLVLKDKHTRELAEAQRDRRSALSDKFHSLTPVEYTIVSYNDLKTARDAALTGRDNPGTSGEELKILADTFEKI